MSQKEPSLDKSVVKAKKVRKVSAKASSNLQKKAPTKIKKILPSDTTPESVVINKGPSAPVISPIQLPFFPRKLKKRSLVNSADLKDVVVLPHTMSIRAREKALAILQKMTEDFSAQKFAYISGLALVFIGGSMSLFSMGFLPGVQHQLSQVVGSVSSSTIPNTLIQAAPTPPMPTFSITTLLPAELRGNADSVFVVTNAENVEARIYNIDTGRVTTLNLDKPAADTYHFRLNFNDFPAGHYTLSVTARALADRSIHNFHGDNFVVPVPLTVPTGATSTTTTPGTVGTSGVSGTSDTSGPSGSTSTTSHTTNSTTTLAALPPRLEIKVTLPSGKISGDSIIRATAPSTAIGVSFYIRPVNTATLSPLGTATKSSDYWYFLYNTRNNPNGDYEVLGRARVNGTYITSDPVKVKIENFIAAPVAVPVPEPVPSPKPVPTPPPVAEETPASSKVVLPAELPKTPPIKTANTTERTFSDFGDNASSTSKEPLEVISKETEKVFAQHRDNFDELLKRYSVAVQSGNPLMIQLALREIETAKSKIVSDALKNPDLSDAAGKLNLELTDRLDVLKDRVDTFEKLRASSSKDDTHNDTDGDGVSDFDEINLYHTDSHQADSDHDGFLDGTEIMKGFDPLNSKSEAPIKYEMPQQSLGLVHDDILKVVDVKPLVKHDETGKTAEVQAEIRGKSLPNSYVTLYIFSTPVVVTVRTDQDGSFVYNFEKELADGQHEVYVAVTDNTGAIVARSNPFKFIKEAQAFTPVDTAHAETADSQSLADFKLLNMYNVAIGLGILAFGLILLMLGVSLRKKNDTEMVIPA
jgi:hypothetical protein